MRNSRQIAAIVAVMLLVSCATSQRSALETAKLAYADASLAYESAMETAVDLRAHHYITDAQWAKIDDAQQVVQDATPNVRAALNLWESSGSQPLTFESALKELKDAVSTIAKIVAEAKHAQN